MITTAFTLLASAAPAVAQQRMPAELIGEWCISTVPDEKGDFPLMYRRGKCHRLPQKGYPFLGQKPF